MLVDKILLLAAILAVGVIYGTDLFYAMVVKKASALSSDRSIADLTGHTHLVADKRMPIVGITAIVCSLLLLVWNFHRPLFIYSGIALAALISHLAIYLAIAKPVNAQMSAAAIAKRTPDDIRALQSRWDSEIYCRAILLATAMVALITGTFAI